MKGDPAERDAGGCGEAAALIPGMDAALTATGQDVRVQTMEEQIVGQMEQGSDRACVVQLFLPPVSEDVCPQSEGRLWHSRSCLALAGGWGLCTPSVRRVTQQSA